MLHGVRQQKIRLAKEVFLKWKDEYVDNIAPSKQITIYLFYLSG